MLLTAAGTGNGSESFVSAGKHGWDLDWSFDCATTGGRGVFVVDVFGANRTPDFDHPGVSEEGDMDSGVYHVPGSGPFYLDVTTTCRWSVEVMESA